MPGDEIRIVSTRDPDEQPVCEITFGPLQWYAPVEAVRATALDMVSCAAYADMARLLVDKLRLPPPTVESVVLDLMRMAGRTTNHGHPDTVTLFPAGGRQRGSGDGRREAFVIFQRGTVDGMVTSTEARATALAWLGAAEATESDQLVAEAMSAVMPGADLARVFGYLRKLRDRTVNPGGGMDD